MSTTIRKVLAFCLITLLFLSFFGVASARKQVLSGRKVRDQGLWTEARKNSLKWTAKSTLFSRTIGQIAGTTKLLTSNGIGEIFLWMVFTSHRGLDQGGAFNLSTDHRRKVGLVR